MPFAEIEGHPFFYDRQGAGVPLLLIGGTGGDLRRPETRFGGPLARHFEVLSYDQRGLGQSWKGDGPFTMADYADDAYHYLWAWLDRDSGHIRSRMFANELGVPEDEATGSAAVRLTAYLSRDLTLTQGEGSQIVTTWSPDGGVVLSGRVVSEGTRHL